MANKIVQKSANNSDMRQIAISKTLEIGKSGQNTTVSDQEIRTNKIRTNEIIVSDDKGEKIDLFEYVNENVTRLDGEVDTLDSRITDHKEYLDKLIDDGDVKDNNDGLVTGDKIYWAIENAKTKIERGKGISLNEDTNTNTCKISLATNEDKCKGIWVGYDNDNNDSVYFTLKRSSVQDDLGGVFLYDGVDNGVSEERPNGFNNINSDLRGIDSDARAATPKAVKTAYDKAVEAHETAISATTTVGENANGLSISRDADGTIIEMATATEENHGTVKLHKGEVESDDTGDSVTTVTSISETRKALEESISETNDRLDDTVDKLTELSKRPLVNVKVVTSKTEWEEIKLNNQLETNTLYLVDEGDQATSGNYVEYMTYTDNEMTVVEQIGTTKLDIDDYVTNDELDTTVKELNESIDDVKLYVGNDTNGDYIPEKGVLTNKINFIGAYVNVVTDESGATNVYIGENTNAPSYSSITDTLAAANIVYASSTNDYALPSDASAGASYARTSNLIDTETVRLNGGAVIGNILKNSIIKVTVTSDTGTTEFETPVLFNEAPITETTKTWTSDTGAITVDATSFKKYTTDDAKDGKTPDTVTGIFTVTLDNDKLVGENGGWYNVAVEIGDVRRETENVFVWKTATTAPSVGTPEITYSNDGSTRQVSGLTYDAKGSFTLTVPTIANTQQWVTADANRLKLSDNSGDVNFAGTITTSGLTLNEETISTNETAVYSYSTSMSASASVKQVSAKISAQAYGQTGAVAGTKVSSNTCTASTWLWTTATADDALNANFHTENHTTYGRKFNTLADITGTASVVAYESSKSLASDYTSQLLVQGGQLKYPNSDTTGRYRGLTGTRYYVRPIEFGGSGQVKKIKVTVSGMSNYNNNTTRIYLVQKGSPNVQVLNWFKTSSCSYGTPVANESNPSNNSWTCDINADAFALMAGTMYYLVVEMDADAAAIGKITLATA